MLLNACTPTFWLNSCGIGPHAICGRMKDLSSLELHLAAFWGNELLDEACAIGKLFDCMFALNACDCGTPGLMFAPEAIQFCIVFCWNGWNGRLFIKFRLHIFWNCNQKELYNGCWLLCCPCTLLMWCPLLLPLSECWVLCCPCTLLMWCPLLLPPCECWLLCCPCTLLMWCPLLLRLCECWLLCCPCTLLMWCPLLLPLCVCWLPCWACMLLMWCPLLLPLCACWLPCCTCMLLMWCPLLLPLCVCNDPLLSFLLDRFLLSLDWTWRGVVWTGMWCRWIILCWYCWKPGACIRGKKRCVGCSSCTIDGMLFKRSRTGCNNVGLSGLLAVDCWICGNLGGRCCRCCCSAGWFTMVHWDGCCTWLSLACDCRGGDRDGYQKNEGSFGTSAVAGFGRDFEVWYMGSVLVVGVVCWKKKRLWYQISVLDQPRT